MLKLVLMYSAERPKNHWVRKSIARGMIAVSGIGLLLHGCSNFTSDPPPRDMVGISAQDQNADRNIGQGLNAIESIAGVGIFCVSMAALTMVNRRQD